MNIDVSHKMYVYPQLVDEITRALTERESITICGVASGKRRLVKKIAYDLNLSNSVALVDLSFIISSHSLNDLNQTVLNYFESLYAGGIRTFVLYNIPFETVYGAQVVELFEIFRKKCLERMSYIFLCELDSNLEFGGKEMRGRNLFGRRDLLFESE